jgi:hypothetical protein
VVFFQKIPINLFQQGWTKQSQNVAAHLGGWFRSVFIFELIFQKVYLNYSALNSTAAADFLYIRQYSSSERGGNERFCRRVQPWLPILV